jgi:hypothetical protein
MSQFHGLRSTAGIVYADRRDAKDFDLHHYYFDSTTLTEAQENQGIRRYDIAARVKNAGDVQVQTWKGPIMRCLEGGLGHEKYKSWRWPSL